jgi:hypothetical protein
LWRTAALGRVNWVRADGESLAAAVEAVYGHAEIAAATVGIVDLGTGATIASARSRKLVPSTVEVEGLRSLGRATVVVAWLAGRRLSGWARRRRNAS